MLRRSKRDPDNLTTKAQAMVDTKATEFWPAVPQTFPDGSPFEAVGHYLGVADLAKRALSAGDTEIAMFCLKVLAAFAMADKEGTRASFLAEWLEVRRRFLANGHEAEVALLSGALLAVDEYHEAMQFDVIIDLDVPRD